MGLLVQGKWQDRWYDTSASGGRFVRADSSFRNQVTAGGGPFPAEPGRYHLFVSLACPWAHRTLIVRKLKKLESVISVSVVHWLMLENGWEFTEPDALTGARFLYEVYAKAKPDYTGRVTVPVLWDKQTNTIVNNESSEIIRMFNTAFNAWGDASLDLYPAALRGEIDRINALVYDAINNGVYKAGFATTQGAYDDAFRALFAALDETDARLSRQRYLAGDRITEADWRLFTTLIRFDAVYHGHFKCNLRRIADYANLAGYLRELYQVPGVAETVNFTHIKNHYYGSHRTINPTGIVPLGPVQDFTLPHGRDGLAAGVRT